mgnify:CR=1 FL=1
MYTVVIVAKNGDGSEGGGGGVGDEAYPLDVFEGAAKINGVAAVRISVDSVADVAVEIAEDTGVFAGVGDFVGGTARGRKLGIQAGCDSQHERQE